MERLNLDLLGVANDVVIAHGRDLLACELRIIHQQNPPLKSASILSDSSHSNWIHFAGQGQRLQQQQDDQNFFTPMTS